MKPTLEEALAVIGQLVATHSINCKGKPLRASQQQRYAAWTKASELLNRAAMPESDFEKSRRELLAMPSVQRIAAASVKVHERLNELGGIRKLDSLTIRELELIAHAALFAKEVR